jgi:hypothetical protein
MKTLARDLLPSVLAICAWVAVGGAAESPYPLWDGRESVADYARRTGLPPTRTLHLGNGVRMEFVLIPAGEFIMGTLAPVPPDTAGTVQEIIIGQALLAASVGVLLVMLCVIVARAIRARRRLQYSLARFLLMMLVLGAGVSGGTMWYVSAERLMQIKAAYVSRRSWLRENEEFERPAYVSWDMASDFCAKLSQMTGWVARLPSEAEWEYACPAGRPSVYGDATEQEAGPARPAWYGIPRRYPDGPKNSNVLGLCYEHGLAYEWVEDDWHFTYGGAPTDGRPWIGNPRGPLRVLRGDAHCHHPWACRPTYRQHEEPDNRSAIILFRVVLAPSSRIP